MHSRFLSCYKTNKNDAPERNLQDNLISIEASFDELLVSTNGDQNEIYTKIEDSFDRFNPFP